MSAAERHNVMAPAIIRHIVGSSETEAEALVLVESVLAGVAFYYARKAERPDPKRAAGIMIDEVAAASIERLATL